MKKIFFNLLFFLSLISCSESSNAPYIENGNTESDAPMLYPEDRDKLTGFIVVKFAKPEYKDYVLARNFSNSRIDKKGYYVPLSNSIEPYVEYFNNNQKFHELADGYYAVDWTLLYTTYLFSNYTGLAPFWPSGNFNDAGEEVVANDTLIKPDIDEEEHKIMFNTKSDFANDMRSMRLTNIRWNDNNMQNLYEKYGNKALDESVLTATDIFSYLQYIFIYDYMVAAGLESEFPKTDSEQGIEQIIEINMQYTNMQFHNLIPLLSYVHYWKFSVDRALENRNEKGLHNSHAAEQQYIFNDSPNYDAHARYLESVQTTLLPILRSMIENNQIEMPQSMLGL